MPIRSGKDKQGTFYRWGTTGKKFYFDPESESSKSRALGRAKKQEAAIYASGYKGDEKMKLKLVRVTKKKSDSGSDAGFIKNVWRKISDIQQELYNLKNNGKVDYKDGDSRQWLFKIIEQINRCTDDAKVIQKKLYDSNR